MTGTLVIPLLLVTGCLRKFRESLLPHPFLLGKGRRIRFLEAVLTELGVEGFCELWS